jgi:hypothetical protein
MQPSKCAREGGSERWMLDRVGPHHAIDLFFEPTDGRTGGKFLSTLEVASWRTMETLLLLLLGKFLSTSNLFSMAKDVGSIFVFIIRYWGIDIVSGEQINITIDIYVKRQ